MATRRAFLIGMLATLAAPPRGTAGGNVSISARRIGVLGPRTPADGAPFIDAFVEGLRALGWENGKNVAIELRWAHGRTDRLAAIATELVHLKVDVILAASTTAAVAASKATTTLPIVVPVVGDPETIGLAANLSRPAGNVTGLTYAVGTGIVGKQLELLKEAIPRVSRVAVVSNPDNPSHAGSVKEVAAAASAFGARLQVLQAHRPSDFDRVFAAIARERADALLVLPDSLFGFHRAQLHAMATRARLPAVYGLREHAEAGGLLSYGVDVRDNFRRAATYVDKILKGAKPADLPIEQPTKFDLVINLKTAKALGLTIPPSLLARADQVIE